MASSKEVLKDWLKQGNYLDDNSVIDSLYNMNAPTDELAEQRFLDMYGNVAPFDKADRIEEPTIPSMDNVIAILGLTDDPKENKNPRTKEQKFIEDFPKKQAEWKKKIVKNPVYGERGWETVKEIWKQAEHQKMLSDIAKARYDAVHDGTLSGFITRMVFPRATEHVANTGDFTTKDILADIAENAAMSIPGAAFTGLAGRGLARVAPRVVNWASKPAPGLVSSTLKGAGNMAGNIFGNAVVPFAAEGMDAAIYGDDDIGMEHRADFSLGDALIGTAINQGVNRGIMRMAGPMIDRFSNGGLARGGTLKARQFLENLGQPFSSKGDDYAKNVAANVSTPIVAEPGEVTEEGLKSIIYGGRDLSPEGQIMEAYKKALREQEVLEGIRNGQIKLNTEKAKKKAEKLAKEKANASLSEVMNTIKDVHGKYPPKYDVLPDGTTNVKFTQPKEETQRIMEAIAMSKKVENAGQGTPVKYFFDTPPEGINNQYPNNSVAVTRSTIDDVIEKNPAEILNYAAWHGQSAPGQGLVGRKERVMNTLNQAVPAWVVNKYGSEGDATMLLSPFPAIKKAIDEDRKEVHEAPKKRKMTKGAADILKVVSDNGDLTEQDRKFLNAIAANPDILKFGYPEDSTAFKLWLLERGNQLLNGTSAFRSTFDVE